MLDQDGVGGGGSGGGQRREKQKGENRAEACGACAGNKGLLEEFGGVRIKIRLAGLRINVRCGGSGPAPAGGSLTV